jgi:cephalosporin hydroxylase
MNEPNFERDRFEGQMNPEERKALYNLIIDTKPEVVCEVGTCRGGGSTYFISSALRNNCKGILYTCENKKEFYDYAISLYQGNPDFASLIKYVQFWFGDSFSVYNTVFEILRHERKSDKIDIVFLDGGACGITMLYDFCMFRSHIPIGGFLAAHDWNNGKSDYLKPVIDNDCDWKKVNEVVGFVIYKRISDVHAQNT